MTEGSEDNIGHVKQITLIMQTEKKNLPKSFTLYQFYQYLFLYGLFHLISTGPAYCLNNNNLHNISR